MNKPKSGGNDAAKGEALAAGFLTALWAGRSIAFASAAAGLLAACVYLAANAFLVPGTTSYRQAITLATTNAKPGFYANGTRFSASDLRGGSIVEKAYGAAGLERFGIKLAEFDAALSSRPYSPAMEQANLKFRSLLSQPGITLDARLQLEEEYRKTTDGLDSNGALIALTLRDDLSVPGDVAGLALSSLLKEWVKLQVDRLGVAIAANARDSARLTDEAAIAALDVSIALIAILRAQEELEERARLLEAVPGTADITINSGKRGLNDVARDAAMLAGGPIAQVLSPIARAGVARDPAMSKLTLSSLIAEDRAKSSSIEQRIRQIDEIYRQFEASRTRNAGDGGSSAAQIDDATISRLVDLAVENADLPFRRDLLNEKKGLGLGLQALNESIARHAAMLTAIQAAETAPPPNAAALAAAFETAAKAASATQNRLWDELNQLAEMTGGAVVDTQKQLYLNLPLKDAVVKSGGLADIAVWLKSLIILLTFLAAGLLLQIGRSALRPLA